MAIPHHIQMHLIKKRLLGKYGKSRLKEISQIVSELPGYIDGPYGNIRRWLHEEIEKTKVRGRLIFRDEFTVRREGVAQIVIVGPPNVGKSSILNAFTNKKVKIANYAFTTIRPVTSAVLYDNIPVQIVEIPGLIEGASEDKGFGRRLLGVIQGADAIVFVFDIREGAQDLVTVMEELSKAKINKPFIVVGNKADLASATDKMLASAKFRGVLFVSANTKEGLFELKEKIWKMTGLMKVYTKDDIVPVALNNDSTVRELALKIHRNLARNIRCARLTGPSAKYPNQIVGLDHVLLEGDRVTLIEP